MDALELEKTIGVIGTGPAGLISAQVLLKDGFKNVEVITRDHTPGGVWAAERVPQDLRINKYVYDDCHSREQTLKDVFSAYTENSDSRVVVMYEMSSALALRRDAYRAPPELSSQYILEPNTDQDLDAWTEPITTKLPYRKFISDIDPGKSSELHLGEDCLIIRCNET